MMYCELLKPQHPSMNNLAASYPEYYRSFDIEDPRRLDRMVKNLAYWFNAEYEDYITFILESNLSTQNDDALRYWIINQIWEISSNHEDVLNYLVEHLKSEIMKEMYS